MGVRFEDKKEEYLEYILDEICSLRELIEVIFLFYNRNCTIVESKEGIKIEQEDGTHQGSD